MSKLALLLWIVPLACLAQHGEHMMDSAGPPMTHAYSLNLPMNRNGSGTAWLPDSSPMFGYMAHTRQWMFMWHGNIFVRYNNQDAFNVGSRGGKKMDAVNWFMFMGQRRVGHRGLFRFNTMISLDNLFGGNGYPLLYQTGESWQGKPLVDMQHPHDLFSELSVAYTYSANRKTDIILYAGYPGEPSIGSVAFMHRVSSLYNPDAPISHHWNDGTHITFGVMTLGVRYGKFKLEGSAFNGREPDENRYSFDRPKLDSYSGRLSFNPNAHLAMQVSEAFVNSPELLHPEENILRTTSSVVYTGRINENSFGNMTALWGVNSGTLDENAFLLEGVIVLRRLAIYSRYEWVQKSREELDLSADEYGAESLFAINTLTIGAGYDILSLQSMHVAAGAQVSGYSADSRLDRLYGRYPVSFECYIRIYPPRMFPVMR